MVGDLLWQDGGIFDKIHAEFGRAVDKHGFDLTPANPRMNPLAKFVILAEEVGEVARSLTYDEGNAENLKTELIQVATMAAVWAASLEDRNSSDVDEDSMLLP